MKFNAEELKQFKKDLDASLKELSNKYNIDITLGKIAVIDDMFSIRLNAEHRPLPKKNAEQHSKQAPAPSPKKPAKKLDNLSDKDLENLDLDDLDLDDLSDDMQEDKKKEEPKKVIPKKPEVKPAPVAPRKPVVPHKPEPKVAPKKPAKKLDNLSDKDLENLDLDDLDLDDISDDMQEEHAKPNKKEEPIKKNDRELENELKEDLEYESKLSKTNDDLEEANPTPKKKKKLDELTDEELVNMDFDDIDFGDEEPAEEAPKPKKRKSSFDEDDDSRYDQELERFLNPGKKVSYDRDPSNVFEEKNRSSKQSYLDDDNDDISDEELEAYMAQSGYYDYSFQAKLIQADSNIQDFYTDVKNLLLSNDGVKSKVMWEYDLFTYKGKPVARLNIEGKTLQVYLGLDPEEYEDSTYNVKIVKDPAYSGTKVLAEINNMNDEDQMYDLIGDLAETHNIMPGEDRYDDYHFQYESLDELIARGLIKEN